jgi:hypothetical protein
MQDEFDKMIDLLLILSGVKLDHPITIVGLSFIRIEGKSLVASY